MKQENFQHDENVCIHYSEDPQKYGGAFLPPTYHTNLFSYSTFEELAKAETDLQHNYVYCRGKNPTVEAVEKKIALLESGEVCTCFSSGMAAISAALINSVKAGDHILCVSTIYYSTIELLTYLEKFQVEHSIVYSTDIEEIENAIRQNTKVIYIESPSYMTFRLVDLEGIAQIGKAKAIRTIIDNTWATPLYQKPLTFGIDMVVHSASKYLGGYNDLMGGAIITREEIMNSLFSKEYLLMGAILPPAGATHLLRGLKTLPIRMKTHQENAMEIARFLESHHKVSSVNYPGLASHPDYELGKKQLSGYTGLMSFELKNADFGEIARVINKLSLFQIGVSWGSPESLVWAPNYGYNVNKLLKEQISPSLIRLSVGLENVIDIKEDLEQALK